MAEQSLPQLGFVGVGAMGGPMARNLLAAGYPLAVFDTDSERIGECVASGAEAAESAAEVVERSETVLTSLRSSPIFVQVAEESFIPKARDGQVFIDMGTVSPPEARRIGRELAEKGASLVDAPVSGGSGGASSGTLYIFVGGEEQVVAGCRPILDTLGDPEHVTYCGPSGSGQVIKAVNQLAMGLITAAHMEAVAFGVRAGVDPQVVRDAVSGPDGWRAQFGAVAQCLTDGGGADLYTKFPELPYFLAEADEKGFPMPLMRALYDFCRAGDKVFYDNMNRETRSFWHELMTRGRD